MSSYDPSNAEIAAGLRSLADFLDQHPELPVWRHPTIKIPVVVLEEESVRTRVVEQYAEALGVETTDDDGHLAAARMFGPVEFQAYRTSDRSQAEYHAETSYGDNVRAALLDRAEAQTAGAR